MATSSEIKQRANALAEKTDVNSITPKEVGGIMYDLASHSENVLRNGGTLGIRKVYESVAAMEADSINPKDFWGDPIKKGNLVVIYDGTTTGVDNNKIYAFLKPGWQIATHLDAGYATRSEVKHLSDEVEKKADEKSTTAKLNELTNEVASKADAEETNEKLSELGSEVELIKRKELFDVSGISEAIVPYYKNYRKGLVDLHIEGDSANEMAVTSFGFGDGVFIFYVNGEKIVNDYKSNLEDFMYVEHTLSSGHILRCVIDVKVVTWLNPGVRIPFNSFVFDSIESHQTVYEYYTGKKSITIEGQSTTMLQNSLDNLFVEYDITKFKYGCPIIDIYVNNNAGHDVIKLLHCRKNETNLLVQVGLDSSDIFAQKYITDVSKYPQGIAVLKLDGNGVANANIDITVIVNTSAMKSSWYGGNPVIKQKKNYLIPTDMMYNAEGKSVKEQIEVATEPINELEERLKKTENAVGAEVVIPVTAPAYDNSNSWFKKYIGGLPNKIGIKAEKTFGVTSSYHIYKTTEDFSSANLELIASNVPFGEVAYVEKDENKPALYLWSSVINPEGFEGSITWFNAESVSSKAARAIELAEKAAYGQLRGKTIVCFGDSITEFAGGKGRYTDYIIEATGATVINVGIGGTQIRQRTVPTIQPSDTMAGYAGLDLASLVQSVTTKDFTIPNVCAEWLKNNAGDDNTAIVARLESIDFNKVDAVTFFAGTNDFYGGQRLGTIDSTNVSETLGAMNVIISSLLSAYPHLKVYWFTPMVRWFASSLEERTDETWSDNLKNSGEGKTLADYAGAIIENAKQCHVPVCDMYWTLGINKANFSNYFYDNDGTHPYNGFDVIGKKMASFLVANDTF